MRAQYFIRIAPLWQYVPEVWVPTMWIGPFASRVEAQAEIERALNAPGSEVRIAGDRTGNLRRAVWVFGIFPKSTATRMQLGDGLRSTKNLLGKNIPGNSYELFKAAGTPAEILDRSPWFL